MKSSKPTYILTAAPNLIGICFLLITGLKLSNRNDQTFADEIGLGSAFLFLGSCILAYISVRTEKTTIKHEEFADYLFLAGLLSMFVAVIAFTRNLF